VNFSTSNITADGLPRHWKVVQWELIYGNKTMNSEQLTMNSQQLTVNNKLHFNRINKFYSLF